VFDVEGHVVSGPPPAPLPTLSTRIEDGQVLVQV
jgi:Rieske Fe-S protein